MKRSLKLDAEDLLRDMRIKVLQHELACRQKEHAARMEIYRVKLENLRKAGSGITKLKIMMRNPCCYFLMKIAEVFSDLLALV